MNKPSSILRNDFINSLVQLVNNSGLPPYVLSPILKDMLDELEKAAKAQFEEDMRMYQASLKMEADENKEVES